MPRVAKTAAKLPDATMERPVSSDRSIVVIMETPRRASSPSLLFRFPKDRVDLCNAIEKPVGDCGVVRLFCLTGRLGC